MFADVVGYSALMGVDEEEAHAVVSDVIGEFKDHIGEYQGEILNVSGDGVLAFFDSVRAAVKFAVSIQEIISRRVPARVSGSPRRERSFWTTSGRT